MAKKRRRITRGKIILIEDYKRIDGWLNIRMNPVDNQSLYDFSEYVDGIYHTLSEAHDLYNKYIENQPERSKREDYVEYTEWEISHFIRDYLLMNENPPIKCNLENLCEVIHAEIRRCGALNSMET